MSKVIASWSGGKDSCLACYKAIIEGHKVKYLMNTISQEYKRVRFHGVRNALIQEQAQAIGIPLIQRETTDNGYEQEFKETISHIIPDGITGMVFGDIYPHMCGFAEKVCKEFGIQLIEPLCGGNTENILGDFINSGFEAIVVATQADLLGKEWVGRKIDKEFIDDLKKVGNVDFCGENGEYHTFVTDGPIFKKKIDISKKGKVFRNGYWFLDILQRETKTPVVSPARSAVILGEDAMGGRPKDLCH